MLNSGSIVRTAGQRKNHRKAADIRIFCSIDHCSDIIRNCRRRYWVSFRQPGNVRFWTWLLYITAVLSSLRHASVMRIPVVSGRCSQSAGQFQILQYLALPDLQYLKIFLYLCHYGWKNSQWKASYRFVCFFLVLPLLSPYYNNIDSPCQKYAEEKDAALVLNICPLYNSMRQMKWEEHESKKYVKQVNEVTVQGLTGCGFMK